MITLVLNKKPLEDTSLEPPRSVAFSPISQVTSFSFSRSVSVTGTLFSDLKIHGDVYR